MEIEHCNRADFQSILRDQEDFWGSNRAASVHHPMFIEEFGATAFVVRAETRIAAYLFGFFVPASKYFYIHLVAVREEMRGNGFAARLYDHVERLCSANGVKQIKAVTPPTNKISLDFHLKRGFEVTGLEEKDGVSFVPNYSGAGRHMSLLFKTLDS